MGWIQEKGAAFLGLQLIVADKMSLIQTRFQPVGRIYSGNRVPRLSS